MEKKKSRVARKTMQLQANMVELLEMPSDIMLDLPKLILIGQKELIIENHRGIIEYGQTVIRVNSTVGQITVKGSGLMLKTLKSDQMLVEGIISAITIED
ncbi:MAG: sporulation protein YqfC [Clostridia bacterium]|jgi:sporulation protein YqfC|nr:sporulation protein YqfC [Clostridia bacterium]